MKPRTLKCSITIRPPIAAALRKMRDAADCTTGRFITELIENGIVDLYESRGFGKIGRTAKPSVTVKVHNSRAQKKIDASMMPITETPELTLISPENEVDLEANDAIL